MGASRMSADWPVPMHRVYFLNPGESISVGDRNLTAVRPPLYDAPGVNGIYDDKSGAFFSIDSFGAIIPVPMHRVYFLNPGESISVGDRNLTAVRPPLYDAPGVNGIYDDKSGAFFSIDSFGAIIPSAVQDAADIPEADLAQGFYIWHAVDQPWVHLVDEVKFARLLDSVRQMAPKIILASHLPPCRGMNEHCLKLMAALPGSEPFVGPTQADLEAMLAQMTGGGHPPG